MTAPAQNYEHWSGEACRVSDERAKRLELIDRVCPSPSLDDLRVDIPEGKAIRFRLLAGGIEALIARARLWSGTAKELDELVADFEARTKDIVARANVQAKVFEEEALEKARMA